MSHLAEPYDVKRDWERIDRPQLHTPPHPRAQNRRIQPMSQVKETTLPDYVIAYLQEETTRAKRWTADDLQCGVVIKDLVDDAIDAYEGGAR